MESIEEVLPVPGERFQSWLARYIEAEGHDHLVKLFADRVRLVQRADEKEMKNRKLDALKAFERDRRIAQGLTSSGARVTRSQAKTATPAGVSSVFNLGEANGPR